MSGTFEEKGTGSESTGKRPTPTIEGTATEVSVEPVGDEDNAAGPNAALPGADADDNADADETGAETGDEADAGEEDEMAERTEPPVAAAERRSFGSRFLGWVGALFTHALAGVAGGLAVLLALTWGYLPSGFVKDAAGVGPIENRIAALETAPKTADSSAELQTLKSRLAEIESKASEAPGASSAEVEALSNRVSQMEASLNSMADAAKDGGSVADAAAISQQVAEAEQRLDEQLQTKIQSEIKSALASGPAASPANTAALDTLKAEIGAIDARLKALTEAELNADGASKLMPDIDALEERLGRIETTLPSLVDALDQENAQTKKASLAIAYASLREAVNEGRPYATELNTLTALSQPNGDLNDLIEYEDRGIPTIPMLAASFEQLRDRVVAASANTGDDSMFDRLLGSAQSLVKVRRIGTEAEGDSADAITARAAANLESGNLQEAVIELEKLSAPQEAIVGPWLDEARARLDAEESLQRFQDDLLVSLAGSENGAVSNGAVSGGGQ